MVLTYVKCHVCQYCDNMCAGVCFATHQTHIVTMFVEMIGVVVVHLNISSCQSSRFIYVCGVIESFTSTPYQLGDCKNSELVF